MTTTPAIKYIPDQCAAQLERLGNGVANPGVANPGVVLDDVEDMQVLYGQPAGANFTYVPAGSAVMVPSKPFGFV